MLTFFTLLRVVVLMALATLVWVPIGVWIGLRPRWAEAVQPSRSSSRPFPVNLLFGAAVSLVLAFHLNPDIWLSALIVFGTQWYILFNVIGGAAAFPNDLREAAANFRVRGWDWWRQGRSCPGIFPITSPARSPPRAARGTPRSSPNCVKWKDQTRRRPRPRRLYRRGDRQGRLPQDRARRRVMSIFVILFNRLLWRPLFAYAERRLRL